MQQTCSEANIELAFHCLFDPMFIEGCAGEAGGKMGGGGGGARACMPYMI